MKNDIKIAVLGGGGKTGFFLVTQLIDKGFSLKLLLRHPESFKIESPLIEIIKGDATDAKSMHSLLDGCQAIVSTLGQRKNEPLVARRATSLILNSMEEYGIERYVLVAGLNVDTPYDKKGQRTIAATEWMKANFPVTHEDRQKAYFLLAASDLNWTLVRVPLIEFTDFRGKLGVSLEDCLGPKISAPDIAGFLIEQIREREYFRKSPFIANI